ncbi:hypothetical protein WR25_22295 [Diploscapter pachys]|uniref:STAS domain-containing protein n=1 Tax=Diploscapter pachys TaxID=2018661 RepID=A0A2A2JTW5_9BILA|nr:hypothetical protein WR25_22295 [Diploscapter pachys]
MIPSDDKICLGSPSDEECSPSEQLPQHLNSLPSLSSRNPMNQDEFDKRFDYLGPPHEDNLEIVKRKLHKRFIRPCSSPNAFFKTLIGFIPILSWLPKYKWRKDIVPDCIGGFTNGILNVPQSIAYASLANVPSQVGLLTSLFPSISYMMFGTSRHCSIGPFAIVAFIVGQAIEKFQPGADDALMQYNGTILDYSYTSTQIASAMCLQVGVIQLIAVLSGIQFVTAYLSDEIVAGFTTAASLQVMATQFRDLTGAKFEKRVKQDEFMKIFITLWDVVRSISTWNICSVILSLSTIAFLVLGKYVLDRRLRGLCRSFRIIIPYELIAAIVGILISYNLDLNRRYGTKIVGDVPTGIPLPSLPPKELILNWDLFQQSLTVSIIVMAVHLSLAKMFSKQFKYQVDTKQEFYALGAGSLLSSLFPVFPNSCSLTRTMLNVNAGSRTQMSTVFSSSILLVLILYGSRWLGPLPRSIVAATIFVALLSAFSKFRQLIDLWRVSKIDFLIWIVAFVATLVGGVLNGLMAAIGFALFTTVVRSQMPASHILANIPGSMDFRDSQRFKEICFINDICVIRFDSPLLFMNLERFQKIIERVVTSWDYKGKTGSDECLVKRKSMYGLPNSSTRYLIIDCSAFSYVDRMGVNCLKDVHLDMVQNGVTVWFAGARANLRELFDVCGFYNDVPKSSFYPTIYDAVYFAQQAKNSEGLNHGRCFSLNVGYTNLASSSSSSMEHIV